MQESFRSYEVSAGVAVIESDAAEFHVYNAPRLREVIIEAVNSGYYRLVVDLRHQLFLDSTGLGVIVGGLKRARAHDGTLAIVCAEERIMKIFRLTGLTRVFAIFPSLAEAVAFVSGSPMPSRYPKKRTAGGADINSHWVIGRVYTSEENAGPSVAASLHDLLDATGLETVFEFPPELGSWFRESIIRRKDSTARPTRDEILADLARTIGLLAEGKMPEPADAATHQAVTDFLVTLEKTPDAVVQVHSLLVIKVRDKIVARYLNPVEFVYWERHPGLARNPGRALRIFRRAASADAAGGMAATRGSQRFLECQAPSTVRTGRVFELMVRIAELRQPGGVAFTLPGIAEASTPVYLLLDAPPGGQVLSDPVVRTTLPAAGDSDQVCFTVRAPRTTGQYRLTVRVRGVRGSELACAQVAMEVSTEPTGPLATTTSRPVRTGTPRGAEAHLTVIRSGPARYCYVLDDFSGHSLVTDMLVMSGDPRPRLRQLTAELGQMASGGAGWRPAGLRDELRARGSDLWRDFLPGKIQEALGELSPGEHALIVSCEHPALNVPWELIYPIERIRGHSDFLAELFDVVRAPYGTAAWCGEFALDPALLVLPDDKLAEAAAEAKSIRTTLGLRASEHALVREKRHLQSHLRGTPFGLLHVAAHHCDKTGTIAVAKRQKFSPADLNEFAGDGGAWSSRRPLVFVNACGTARSRQRFTQFTSWAQAFFEAGAGGFVGSMWDVRSDTASAFAQRFYQAIYTEGLPFSGALRAARDRARSLSQDPTWLAYAAHGDPAATVLADVG